MTFSASNQRAPLGLRHWMVQWRHWRTPTCATAPGRYRVKSLAQAHPAHSATGAPLCWGRGAEAPVSSLATLARPRDFTLSLPANRPHGWARNEPGKVTYKTEFAGMRSGNTAGRGGPNQ